MLLFIEKLAAAERKLSDSFNTSHVVVYHRACSAGKYRTNVSIHLMLLFIEKLAQVLGMESEFQYISCCCLSAVYENRTNSKPVSIHLMLLFILLPCVSPSPLNWFQYISCCCLSVGIRRCECVRQWFQYISCCCLSLVRTKQGGEKIEFQYISCCCLSHGGVRVAL